MKMAISFIAGIIVCSLLLFGIRLVLPIQADTSDNVTESSDNLSQRLIDLLPDIEKIYRQALTAPFINARSKIYDADIARFYDNLLDKTGLNQPSDNGTN
jgi:hypothetical protein